MLSGGYLGLFLAAFLAATVFPFYSEAALVGLLALGYSPLWLWFWATAGNTLGAAVNWALGRFLLHYQDRKWFPIPRRELERAQRWFNRFGVWSLLLAWLPIGGDALTLAAGALRVPFWLFFLLTAIGKGARYAVLIVLFPGG